MTDAVDRGFPDTSARTAVFSDQLALSRMTDSQIRFAATRYVGVQKVTRSEARRLRQHDASFLALHYRLGQALGHSLPSPSGQPTTNWITIIEGDRWVREWPGDEQVRERRFTNGVVVVNPAATTRTARFGTAHRRVHPVGGGIVAADGTPAGALDYTAVTTLTLGPRRAAVLS